MSPNSKIQYIADYKVVLLSNFRLTFVTGSSSNHFIESVSLIKSFQRYFPGKVLLYYDLGLKRSERDKVSTSWSDGTHLSTCAVYSTEGHAR